MMEFLAVFALVCAAFYAGWKLREWYAEFVVKQYMKQYDEKMKNTVAQKTINIDIQKHGDMLYVYNEDDGSFMTQIQTAQQLLDFVEKKYPDYYIMMKTEQKALFEGM